MVGSRRRRAAVDVLLVPTGGVADTGARGLSHEDRSRASAIGDPAERDRFFAGRRLLRHALAERTGRPAEELRIASGPNGQAFLLGGGPHFSLASNEHWYAIAFADDCPVGAAIASTRDRARLSAVVRPLLPARALEDIRVAAPSERTEATLRWWVRMEAAVRACGASRDQADRCLSRVACEVGDSLDDAVVAVAGCTDRPLQVRWNELRSAPAVAPA